MRRILRTLTVPCSTVVLTLAFASAASALPKTPLRLCKCSCSVVDDKGKLWVGELPIVATDNCLARQGQFHGTPTVPPCEGKGFTSSIYRTTECRDETDNYSQTGGTVPGTVSPTVPSQLPVLTPAPSPITTPATIPSAIPRAAPSALPRPAPSAVPGALPSGAPVTPAPSAP